MQKNLFLILVLFAGLCHAEATPQDSPTEGEIYIGEEFGLDNPVYGITERDQHTPTIAFDGTNYLVVWSDGRGLLGSDIYGTFISAEGKIITNNGFMINARAEMQVTPSIIFDGVNYFVVWIDYGNSPSKPGSIYGARISVTGKILDPEGIPINISEDNSKHQIFLGFDGTNYLVAWKEWVESKTGTYIFAKRISKNGEVIDSKEIAIGAVSYDASFSISFDGSNYLIAWVSADSERIMLGNILKSDGLLLFDKNIVLDSSSSKRGTALFFDGEKHFLVWTEDVTCDETGEPCPKLYGSFVDKEGTVLNSEAILILDIDENIVSPQIVADGVNFFLVWGVAFYNGFYNYYATSIDQVSYETGDVLEIYNTNDQYGGGSKLSLAFNGESYMFTLPLYSRKWHDDDIYGKRMSRSGKILDEKEFLISNGSNEQKTPVVTFDGTRFFVAWEDVRHDDITRISAVWIGEGEKATLPITVEINRNTFGFNLLSTVYDGGYYILLWSIIDQTFNDTIVYASMIDKDGNIYYPDGTSLAGISYSTADGFALGTNHNTCLLVYEGYETINGIVFNGESLLKSENVGSFKLSRGTPGSMRIASDGSNYFIVWPKYESEKSTYNIYGIRVAGNGKLINTKEITIATKKEPMGQPSIDYDGENYLVSWTDNNNYINATLVSKEGKILKKASAIMSSKEKKMLSSTSFNGSSYLVTWLDARNDPKPTDDQSYYDLYGAFISKNATFASSDFLITSDITTLSTPMVAATENKKSLVTYQKFNDEILVNNERIMARFIDSSDVPMENFDPGCGCSLAF
ncbi:MAG TPA: hypothetical protein PLV42_10750 [bacterium]|nr:hypothetical protein [bacterium]